MIMAATADTVKPIMMEATMTSTSVNPYWEFSLVRGKDRGDTMDKSSGFRNWLSPGPDCQGSSFR